MKILIVVPNLNYGRFLNETLMSLESQRGVDFHVVVVDGGSVDESLGIAREFCDRNDWDLEVAPGLGQAASIKYCFEQAKYADYEILGWLNSDDVYLHNQVLCVVEKYFSQYFDLELASFGGYFIDAAGRTIKRVVYDYSPHIRGDVFGSGRGVLQPATFWRRTAYAKIRSDTSKKYIFDALWIWALKDVATRWLHDPTVALAGYRLHETNLSLRIPSRRISELASFYEEVLHRSWAANYLKSVYLLFSLFDRFGLGERLKGWFRKANNVLSYLTGHLVPSI